MDTLHVEILGNAGHGKTVLSELIANYLKSLDFEVLLLEKEPLYTTLKDTQYLAPLPKHLLPKKVIITVKNASV